jgi:asparagine synthase (glutamine-hydrolysing)
MAGLVELDRAPVSRELLGAVLDQLRFRGPDAARLWSDGSVGFAHTLLATTDEAQHEAQPCSLDGRVWLVADARIDGRTDLTAALVAAGCSTARGANDAELILHAYAAWGERCVDHLLGDFAFAIWDADRRLLFCARDHFGARPFFYAQCGTSLVFSNTLAAVRRHPRVSNALDDQTIADYLLTRYNPRADATGFADIRRLPPGHLLRWTPGSALQVHRYWQLSLPAEIRYRHSHEYVDHFNQILDTAVRDRLRTPRAVVAMSGGLDSTTLAVVARRVARADHRPLDLRAQTIVYDRVLPDQERRFAGLAANAIGIPIDFLPADDYQPYDRGLEERLPVFPEPTDVRYRSLHEAFWSAMARDTRVVLSGDDADSVLNEPTAAYFRALLAHRRPLRFVAHLATFIRRNRRIPPLGLRTALLRRERHSERRALPPWIAREFAVRNGLGDRLKSIESASHARPPLRPRTLGVSSVWWRNFENVDAGITRQPLEYRWPFADRRLVEYLLAIPTVPWCVGKTVMRDAMVGLLPDAVRLRKKQGLAGDPLVDALRQPDAAWIDRSEVSEALDRYLDRRAISSVTGEAASGDAYFELCPRLLNWWFRTVERNVTL